MVTNPIFSEIFYFIVVISVLVSVHEFGHFLAARLCKMRTDIFSIGFGTRLFGFNKRAGFTIRENPPNKIHFSIEEGSGVGGSAKHLTDERTITLIEQACASVVAKNNNEIIQCTHATVGNFPEKITVTVVLEKCVQQATLEELAGGIETSFTAALRAEGITLQTIETTYGYEGAGICDYRLSLLPIGGYVKIAGMIDESMDTQFLSAKPQPWEFRAHPTWQKIIVICAGVAMNVILALGLYTWLAYSHGEETYLTRTVGSVSPNSYAEKIGFHAGDEIEAVNGSVVKSWNDFFKKMLVESLQKDVNIRLRRTNSDTVVTIPYGVITPQSDSLAQNIGVYPSGMLPVIVDVNAGTPAETSGIQAKDSIINVNGIPMSSDVQLISVIHEHAGKQITLGVKRADGMHAIGITPDADGHIGVHLSSYYTGPSETIHYNIQQAFVAGAVLVSMDFSQMGDMLWKLVRGKTSIKQNLAGPIAIAKMAGKTSEEGIGYLLTLMAMLSVSLAGLNILPIPALDGGHLVFIVIEGAIRREVPQKVKIAVQQIGFFALLALMLFIVYNDLTR